MHQHNVYIVGGGLAGMTVAKVLAEHGVSSTILEASGRLGGKAAADYSPVRDVWEDHGYHVFPGWYINTRKLLKDIGAIDNLVDMDKFFHLSRPEEGKLYEQRLHAFYPINNAANLIKNMRSGMLSFWQSMLSFYFMADLSAESFRTSGALDRQSPNGFLRSRFYATEKIAQLHEDTTLQASSIPNYEVSANTIRKLGRYWLRTPTPMFSVMNDDLQSTFIDPFRDHLLKIGENPGRGRVTIQTGAEIGSLVVEDGRILTLGKRFLGGEIDEGTRDDIYVITTPPEKTREFIPYIFRECPAMSDIARLRSAPMAALHLYFKRKLTGIPWQHVTLFRSLHGLSFIDISQVWKSADPDRTTLSVISSNFEPLALLHTRDDMAMRLIDELCEYVPSIAEAVQEGDLDLAKSLPSMQPRTDTPLFLNTVGAWECRPVAHSDIGNLYFAGDYCQTAADLTTMESAVESGIWAASAILEDTGAVLPDAVRPLEIPVKSRAFHLMMKYAPYPAIRVVSLFVKRWDQNKNYENQDSGRPRDPRRISRRRWGRVWWRRR